jgi:hypothetical protein
MDIRPLATGRSDVLAFELTGTDVAPLRREAQRLCPQGGEILRQAGRDQQPEKIDGRLRGWIQAGNEWIAPPQRAAQLVVLCREAPGAHLLAAAAPAAEAASAPATEAAAGPPVGPLAVEW